MNKRYIWLLLLCTLMTIPTKSICKPKLTLSMIMKNEANRSLRRMLQAAREYIDEAVIIDDASTDNSVEICKEVLQGIPLHLIQNKQSKFSNEINLRKQQWEETLKTDPDWILILDADEIFEAKFKDAIQELLNQDQCDVVCFRLYDFWDENHYRDDQYWLAHNSYRPFLIRPGKNRDWQWNEVPQHCGRHPKNIGILRCGYSILRLKHYGWAKEEDRIAKYKRYQMLDPNARYGWKEQYESILDPNPHLIEWIE